MSMKIQHMEEGKTTEERHQLELAMEKSKIEAEYQMQLQKKN